MIDSFDIVHIFQRSYIHDLYAVYDLYDLAHVCRVGAVKFASSATCFLGWDLYCTDAAQHLKAA